MVQEAKLRVVEGSLQKLVYVLPTQGEFRVGRISRCDMAIMSRRVSKNHAKVVYSKGAFTLEDLGSKTGTLVNERKITSTVLRDNDLIQIGSVKLRFVVEESQEPDATPEPSSQPIMIRPKPTPLPPPPVKQAEPTEVEVPAFSPEELDAIGQTFGGIKLIAALARGRRTVIYKGIQSARNRVVAFKMLSPEAAEDRAIAQWFISGAREAGKLRHEDAVTPMGGGRDAKATFAYSAFMENGSAQETFSRTLDDGLPAIKMALESIVHVARALEFGQSKGIFHLGVRPTKLLYNENRRAKLGGLGFDNGPGAPGAISSQAVAAYLSPEQLKGTSETTAATDIFSLGATFYYMLTGQQPTRDSRQRIPSPKRVNGLIPDSICRIIEKMVDPARGRRYKTYGQLLHDVRWALRGEAWPHR